MGQMKFNMAKRILKPAVIPLRAWRFALMVVGFSLSLQTLCQGQETGLLNVPTMNFGDFFYVYYINGTCDLLYECFCDIRITHCVLTFKLTGDRNGFPYRYLVTNVLQTRVANDRPLSELYTQYSSIFLCDTLEHVTEGILNCRRPKVTHNPCAPTASRCISFMITHTSKKCSFDCTVLKFFGKFALKITTKNFDDRPAPVKDGVCPTDSLFTTSSPNITVSSGNNNETEKRLSEIIDIPTDETENSDFDTSVSIVFVLTGAAGAFIVIVTLAAFINLHIRQKKRYKEISQVASDSCPTYPSRIAQSLEVNGNEAETEAYHTLDEMAIKAEPVASLDESDEEGYQKIKDGNIFNLLPIGRDVKKVCRPLPKKPSQAANVIQESSSDVSPYNALSSPYLKVLDDQISAVPNSISKTTSGHELSNNPSRPQPHRRMVDLEDHQYLGLVNLRPNEMFGHMTEVKLVRSKLGNLELVDSHEESPAFADYYTRIQLIQGEDNVLSVVGVLEKTSCDEDKTPRSDNLETPAANVETLTTRCAKDDESVEMDKPNLEIIFIGSLESDQDTDLSPCDYMTVRDIEATCKSSGGYGYLTPLDIDIIKGSHGQSIKD